MINFRFHIVSLTAVLLALGIGLVLGTTFLDDAVEDQLKRQLDELEQDLDREGERNAQLRSRLEDFENEAAGLNEQLGQRLFAGQLQDDPVLVLSTAGVDDDTLDSVMASLDEADADVVGMWQFTDRLTLDDDGEVADLATALDLSTDDTDRLRRNLAMQLADVLYGATDLPDEIPSGAGGVPGDVAASSATPDQSAPAEPEIAGRLREAGFVDYDLRGNDGDVIRLPAWGLRVVVVSGPDVAVPVDDVVLPLLRDLATDGPVPVVATEQSRVEEEDPTDDDAADRVRLVTAIRDDDDLADRISTVDDLERVAGRVATLLAVVDAAPGDPVVGHYGTEDGTQLLPPVGEGG
jgi:hypothetical protein